MKRIVLLLCALVLGLASASALRVRSGSAERMSLDAAAEVGSGGSGGESGGSTIGESSAPGGPSGGPRKRDDWLSPLLPATVAVPKEPSDEKAIKLIQEMKKPWEGMEDPRLSQTHEGMDQEIKRRERESGKKIVTAGQDTPTDPDVAPAPKTRAGVPQLPPTQYQRTRLWDPNDILAKTAVPVSFEWDAAAEKKMVDAQPYHPLHIWSDRTNPMWAADVRNMHNERYKRKFKDNKKYIPPNMRLNPPFFPHVVARYTDRVPSSDLNANPVEWPVAPRYIGEKPHGPYDQYHENPDRYLAPLKLSDWRTQQRARHTAQWPKKIEFPRMPAPGDTFNHVFMEMDSSITRSASMDDLHMQLSNEIDSAINAAVSQAEAEETETSTQLDDEIARASGIAHAPTYADAEGDQLETETEAEAVDDTESEEFEAVALAETGAEAEAEAETEVESESEAEAESESELTPKEMYWYWVQPYKGKDRFGRDGRLFTPSHPLHPMAKYRNAADAATGHSSLHVPTHPPPTRRVDGVELQYQTEAFDTSAALPLADLQRKLDIHKENGAKAARALINDDRAPYLFTDGKQDEADYAAVPGPTKGGNEHDKLNAASAAKAAGKISPWTHGPDGDLADHPNFPYASFRRDYLGQVRGFKVPMPQPSLKYEHIKAGSKADFPVSYGGEQKEKPTSFIEADSEAEADESVGAEEEDQLDEGEYEADSNNEQSEDEMESESDESNESESEDAVFLQMDEELSARAHIPHELHAAPPAVVTRRPPAPIRLDEDGNPIEHEEEEEESEPVVAVETDAHTAEAAHAEAVPTKPWWATKAGRARNEMPPQLRERAGESADPSRVLDQPMFRQAYSGPVDTDKVDSDSQPHGSAAALLDSLAALARNPLSEAPNVFAGQPRSKADRALATAGMDAVMEEAGIDADAPRTGDADSAEAPTMDGPTAAGGDMRFSAKRGGESPAKFDADFQHTESAIANASPLSGVDAATEPADSARFAEAPKTPKPSVAGYGVGLRGMILSQDAAIIAGPNHFRSPTLVNPWSVAAARAGSFAGAYGSNYPYNYPYPPSAGGMPQPAPAPAAAAAPQVSVSSGGPRGVPTTVVNIYGGSGAVSTGASTTTNAATQARSPKSFAAYPAPLSPAVIGGTTITAPWGDGLPPAAGGYPPPLSGLMDIAYSMQGRSGPGYPPTPLYGHPFKKVPVPQFPPSSPTVPYPRYPMGPQGALAEAGWQKPRLVPIVYGAKV